MKLISHFNGVIKMHKKTNIRVSVPVGVNIIADIYKNGKKLGGSYARARKNSYGYDISVIRPPHNGKYVLRMFSNDPLNHEMYELAMEYKIVT